MKIVKHLKSGRFYISISSNIINGTNAQNGQMMSLYFGKYKNKRGFGLFVRENSEFTDKFKAICKK